jgi:hypothetical protein
MSDLLDIAPSTSVEVVKIAGGRRLTVRGLHGNDIAAIASRFPNLIALFAAAGDNVARLIGSFGAAVGAVIAAGCDHLGDEKAEQVADRLLVEDQIKLLKAIFWLTFPNGLSSFMEVMASLLTEPMQKPIKVKIRSRKSPSASPPLSATDSRPTMQ